MCTSLNERLNIRFKEILSLFYQGHYSHDAGWCSQVFSIEKLLIKSKITLLVLINGPQVW